MSGKVRVAADAAGVGNRPESEFIGERGHTVRTGRPGDGRRIDGAGRLGHRPRIDLGNQLIAQGDCRAAIRKDCENAFSVGVNHGPVCGKVVGRDIGRENRLVALLRPPDENP